MSISVGKKKEVSWKHEMKRGKHIQSKVSLLNHNSEQPHLKKLVKVRSYRYKFFFGFEREKFSISEERFEENKTPVLY